VPEITLSIPTLAYFSESRSALELAGLGSRVPTIEILWDGYVSLDPARLADRLHAITDRVMIHVMWSRYLELDDDHFADYLERFTRHVRALQPVAVSDHLSQFRFDGLFVGSGQEYTYDHFEHVAARVARYQDAIGQPLLIENNASVDQPGDKQLAFVSALIERTGCGILFDISNAVAGELNGQGAVDAWLPLLAGRTLRCHVGSYQLDVQLGQYIDTHAAEVTAATEAAIRKVTGGARVASITYERDSNRSVEAIARDLRRISECACR
jgi:uncharacterized protein (UPF0276 family)